MRIGKIEADPSDWNSQYRSLSSRLDDGGRRAQADMERQGAALTEVLDAFRRVPRAARGCASARVAASQAARARVPRFAK